MPLPTLMAVGIGGDNTSHYWLEEDAGVSAAQIDKPPYRVPTMADINAIPWNGLNVVSLFAGGGGSTTGYRMAGCRVLWANEWIKAARETYAANHPSTVLDARDIHDLDADDIFAAIGLKEGELDILDGSPPCQSFSMAGQRERGWNKKRDYGDGHEQRNTDLFFEYARILRDLHPKVFIAENVSGLIRGIAKGYFKKILQTLKECGYRVEARLLDAQWLGVPQHRERIIFVGVRNGLDARPAFPRPLSYRYSMRDALGVALRTKSYSTNGWIEGDAAAATVVRSDRYWTDRLINDSSGFMRNKDMTDGYDPPTVSARVGSQFHRRTVELDDACNTIAANGTMQRFEVDELKLPLERRKLTIAELRRICSFPDDYVLTGSYTEQWARCGDAVPPVMMSHIAATVRDSIFARL